MRKRNWKPNYSVDEVEGLIEYYAERDVFTSKLNWLVRYCDLELAIREMPPKEYQAVFSIGIAGLTLRDSSRQFGVSTTTMWTRYNRGIVWITNHLNKRD